MTSSTSPFNSGRVLGVILATFTLVSALLVGFNYRVDRYGVYHSSQTGFIDRSPPNIYYLKSRHLLEGDREYDCLVLGSSRVAALDTNRFPGECYNFNHPFGSLEKGLDLLERLIERDRVPAIIYLGLDDASYSRPDTQFPGSRAIPSGPVERLRFHAQYLLKFPQWVDLDIFSGTIARIDKPWIVRDPSLEVDQLREEQRGFLEDPRAHEQYVARQAATVWGIGDYSSDALENLTRIRTLAREWGIDLVLFINPMHYKTYLHIDHELFSDFRRGLARVLPFYDFSGLTPDTLDNLNWKETSHFLPSLGDHMVDCLTNELARGEGVCKKVDDENIESFLVDQQEADRDALFHHPWFSGVTIIPAEIGQFMLDSRPESITETVQDIKGDVSLNRMQQAGDWLHTDDTDPQIFIGGSCFDPQSVYLLRLQLDFPESQILMTYTPRPGGGYKAGGSDRLQIMEGSHWVYLLVRDLDCDSHVRLDPLQKRGDLFLHKVLLDRVGYAVPVAH